MRDTIKFDEAAFAALRRDETDVWQIGVRRVPAWYKDSKAPAGYSRPAVAICIGRNAGAEIFDGDRKGNLPPDALARVLTRATRLNNTLPARIEVSSQPDAFALQALVASRGVMVEVKQRLLGIDRFVDELDGTMNKGRQCPYPSLMAQPGMTLERIASFAEAATLFAKAKPWTWVVGEAFMSIEPPVSDDAAFSICSAIGELGDCIGLAFHESAEQIAAMSDGPGEFWKNNRRLLWVLMFEEICELPMADADLWLDHGLPAAGKEFYPLPYATRDGKKFERPDAARLAAIEAVLRAYAAGSRNDQESGSWTSQVTTISGPRTVTLCEIPMSDDADDHEGSREKEFPTLIIPTSEASPFDRAVAEAAMFGAVGAAGGIGAGRRKDGAWREAQQLCYQAMESDSIKQRKALCRRALGMHPDCCDALTLLVEIECRTPADRIDRLRAAVEAGERSLGPEAFKDLKGEFWSILDTRPFMRAKAMLAEALSESSQTDEALRHWREMLELNPNDNQGARHRVLGVLLAKQEGAEAARLWSRYHESASAWWLWGRVLIALLKSDRAAARRSLAEARDFAPEAEKYLTDSHALPDRMPDWYTPGEESEAVAACADLLPGWRATPGAQAWLRAEPFLAVESFAHRSGTRAGFKKRKKRSR